MTAPSLPSLLVSHWHPVPSVTAYMAVAVAIYAWATIRARRPWPLRRAAAFALGLLAIAVALESGLDAFDDQMLSVHMVQHLLLFVLAPVLLLLGQPMRLALLALPRAGRRRLGRGLTGARRYAMPLVCLAVFWAVIFGTHIPAFYDATLRHPALHDAEHVLYLLAGLLLWWPVLGADPAPSRRLNGFLQVAYLLGAMVPMEVLGAYLSRATNLFYPAYGGPGRALGISPLTDQADAGAIMWVCGGMLMVAVVLWSSMQAMVEEERRQQARERHAGAAAAGSLDAVCAVDAVEPGAAR